MNNNDYIKSVLEILGVTAADIEIEEEARPLAAQAFALGLPAHVAAASILAHWGAQADLVQAVAQRASA